MIQLFVIELGTAPSELKVRQAVVSAVAQILYGEFDGARRGLAQMEAPSSMPLSVMALQPELLLHLFEAQDFARAIVTAHQGRDLANTERLAGDPAGPQLRRQWDTYLLIAEVLAGRRPRTDLDGCVTALEDPHLEVVARWATVSAAARAEDALAYSRELNAYRAIAPHCVAPLSVPSRPPTDF